MSDDQRWEGYGINGQSIQTRAVWLAESRGLRGGSLRFFELAGKILAHARTDYALISPVFFHAILGLERALKLHYKDDAEYLKALLARAIADGLLHVGIFSPFPPLTKELQADIKKCGCFKSHHEMLAEMIPAWRNEYFHGVYLLAPDYFHLTIQMREIADVLITRRSRAAGL